MESVNGLVTLLRAARAWDVTCHGCKAMDGVPTSVSPMEYVDEIRLNARMFAARAAAVTNKTGVPPSVSVIAPSVPASACASNDASDARNEADVMDAGVAVAAVSR